MGLYEILDASNTSHSTSKLTPVSLIRFPFPLVGRNVFISSIPGNNYHHNFSRDEKSRKEIFLTMYCNLKILI